MNRDGYRDQIVTHDVGVSLHSKTHPLFMKYSNGTSTCSLSELVSCAFSTIPICPFLINSKNFSFTCNTLGYSYITLLYNTDIECSYEDNS